MHIFMAMASGARGGGANHLLALLPALARQGIDISAWVGDDGPLAEQLTKRGIRAQARPLMARRGDVLWGRRLVAAAVASGADLLHLHGTRAGVLGTLGAAVSRRPPPRIYSAHGLAHRAGGHALGRGLRLGGECLACLGAAAVLSVSSADLNVLQGLPGMGGRLSLHVPNVVCCAPPANGDGAAHRRRARARFGLPADGALVGTVSRLVPQKNVAALADAVLHLADSHLAVVGEGPQRGLLEAHPLARRGRLHLLGAQDDVPAFLPALDVFALSSRWEGEPIALLEAMAFGLPWVATRTLGAEEIHRASGSGIIVNQRQPKAFAQALQYFLSHPEAARQQGQAGQRAMARRTPSALAQTMAQIYAQVLS
jgi:glycosyltransferase involved in cell wall biosynthesis